MIRKLLDLTKRSIALLVYYTGIGWIVLGWALRRRAIVLMYHRVLPAERARDSFSAEHIVITPETFGWQMRFLQKHFTPVTAEQFQSMMSGESEWVPRACLVTFDDGWRDNVEFALPILRREKMPALVFLATAYVGTDGCFWQERLTRLLHTAAQSAHGKEIFKELDAASILDSPESARRRLIRAVVASFKTRPRSEVDAVIARISGRLGSGEQQHASSFVDRFMSWSEVGELAGSSIVALGSHAHSHTPLNRLSEKEVATELETAAHEIRRSLGLNPQLIAYPNGDYNDTVISVARAQAYRLGFTTDRGWAKRGDDPLRIRRVNVAEPGTDTPPAFLCRLLGLF